jgi:hypothetical protein
VTDTAQPSPYTFTVAYADDVAVAGASVGPGNVTVTGPAGVPPVAVEFVSATGAGASVTATYRFVPPGGAWDAADSGTYTVAVGPAPVADTAGNDLTTGSPLGTFTVALSPPPAPGRPLVVGGPANGTAVVYSPDGAGRYAASATLSPFGGVAAEVRTAVADVDGDGVPDAVLVTGPGVPVRFAVVSGRDHATILVPPTDPFGSSTFTGGGFVAAADLTGDGRAEVVVTPDQGGGPNVVLYSLNPDGTLAAPRAFFALGNPSFRGGARVAVGDVNADGTPDLAVGAGFLGGPNVEVHDGRAVGRGDFAALIGGGFFAFDGPDAVTLRNGVFLALGDLNGDRFADLIAGGGPGGGSRVLALDGRQLAAGDVLGAYAAPVANFFFGSDTDRGGVRVAATDVDGDARADLVVGSGEGSPSRVRVYPGRNIAPGGEPAALQDLDPFAQLLPGGVFVG